MQAENERRRFLRRASPAAEKVPISARAASAASVRLLTLSALRKPAMLYFTVDLAKSRARQIILLLLPCIKRARTLWCFVSPRPPGRPASYRLQPVAARRALPKIAMKVAQFQDQSINLGL